MLIKQRRIRIVVVVNVVLENGNRNKNSHNQQSSHNVTTECNAIKTSKVRQN